jgi:hypothetical protein
MRLGDDRLDTVRLAGGRRLRAGDDDQPGQIGALGGKAVGRAREPVADLAGRMVDGIVDHAGVAAMEGADVMDGVAQVARRRQRRRGPQGRHIAMAGAALLTREHGQRGVDCAVLTRLWLRHYLIRQ